MTPIHHQPDSDPLVLRLANRPPRRAALISLTPLIDVVFILLIFFMLATALEQWKAIQLESPAPTAAGTSIDGAILIDIRHEGLRLSGRPITPDALSTLVIERLRTTPDQRFLVRPGDGIPLQRAVAVLDRLAAAGGRNISLIRAPGR